MGKHQTKILILACFIISAVSMYFILAASRQEKSLSSEPQKSSYAPPIASANTSENTNIVSPDGKAELVFREEKGRESTTYKFSIINRADGSVKQILTKTVPVGTSISIPFNTFSPDNKYLFLKEESQSGVSYFVISGTETPISESSQTLDISSVFAAKYQEYKIGDVTGWGGMNLVVVNSDKKEGGLGPSFWFEVPSQSLIQLSGRFN